MRQAQWSKQAVTNLLKSQLAQYPQDMGVMPVNQSVQLIADVSGFNFLDYAQIDTESGKNVAAQGDFFLTWTNDKAYHFVSHLSVSLTASGGADGLVCPIMMKPGGTVFSIKPPEHLEDFGTSTTRIGWEINLMLPPSWQIGFNNLIAMGAGATMTLNVVYLDL